MLPTIRGYVASSTAYLGMYGIYLTSTARNDEVSYLVYLTNYNNTSRLFPGTWYSNKYGAYPVRCIIDY